MVPLRCPGWALLPELYTPDGLNVFLAVGFFLCHTLGWYWRFLLSLGGPAYGSVHQCSYFIVSRFVCFPVPTLFFYVIDIFSSGFGSSVSSDDCQVNQLKQKLKLTVFALRASGTSENYLTAFNRWAEFTKGVLGVPVFPVGPMDCALYLQSLLQSSKSATAINCAFYAFKWLHQVAGVDSPTLHPIVITAKDGAVRLV